MADQNYTLLVAAYDDETAARKDFAAIDDLDDLAVEAAVGLSRDDDHGVTKFELPEGRALLRVSPICRDGMVASTSTYSAPAPEQRMVIKGNTISLFGVELLLEVSSCDVQACICQ
jgi:hypothetical protein